MYHGLCIRYTADGHLFPTGGYYNKYEQSYTWLSVELLGHKTGIRLALCCFQAIFQEYLYSHLTNVHSYQQRMTVPTAPPPHQHLIWLVLLMVAIQMGLWWYLSVVFICISLWADEKHLFKAYWIFGFLFKCLEKSLETKEMQFVPSQLYFQLHIA